MKTNLRAGTRLASAAALTALLLVPATARAYDRTPIRVSGLVPDGWGQTTTEAEILLRGRYAGVRNVLCFPVIEVADPADSSFVIGMTRYWDKLACAGTTWSGHSFALVYDAKGRNAWIIYRLRGITIAALRG